MTSEQMRRPLRLGWPILLTTLGLAVIAGIWVLVLTQLSAERARVLDVATRDVQGYAKTYGDTTERLLAEADRATLLIKYEFEKDGSIDLMRLLRRNLLPATEYLSANVTDQRGTIVVTTREAAAGIYVGDRDYFLRHLGRDTRVLDISKPVMGRASGRVQLQLTRRLNAADGSFAGVVILVAEPALFTDAYQEADLGKQGVLEVVDRDGTYLARRSGSASVATAPEAGAATLLAHARGATSGTYDDDHAVDGIPRIVAFRALPDRGIIVAAQQAKQEILTEYERHRAALLSLTTVATVLLAVAFVIVGAQIRQLHASRQRARTARETLRAAANGSLDAFYLLGAMRDDRGKVHDFVFLECNDRGGDLLQRDKADVIGHRLRALLLIDRGSALFAKWVRVIDTEKPLEEEFENVDLAIDARWLRQQVVKVNDGIAITSRDITQRREDAADRDRQRRLIETILAHIPAGVIVTRASGKEAGTVLLWNPASEVIYGTPADLALGKAVADLVPADVGASLAQSDRLFLADPTAQELRLNILAGDRARKIRLHRAPIYDGRGRLEHVVAIASDVTDESMRASQIELASKVFETTADGIFITDGDDRVVLVNPAFTKMTGYEASELIGKQLAESVFRPLDPEESASRYAQQRRDGFISCEVKRRHKDGRDLSLWITASLIYDEMGQVVHNVRVFSDISPLKASQAQLETMVRQDSLTGLSNRRAFHEELERSIARAKRGRDAVGLLFIDLDGFKQINDSLGHEAGDAVLKEVAARLTQSIRGTDVACRLGGDEFTVILTETKAAPNPDIVVGRILEALDRPVSVNGIPIAIAASIGVAAFPQNGEDADALVRNADAAMYQAKRGGGRGPYRSRAATSGEVAKPARVLPFLTARPPKNTAS